MNPGTSIADLENDLRWGGIGERGRDMDDGINT